MAVDSETPSADFTEAPSVYPNPTSGSAMVSFDLASASVVSVEVLDGLGRRVAIVTDREFAAGQTQLSIPTAGLAPGVYLVRVQTDAAVSTTRFSVVR